MMRSLLAALLLSLSTVLLSFSFAAVSVVESPGPSILYRADGTQQAFKSYAECLAAAGVAAAPGEKSRCSTVTNIVKVGECDASEPPALPEDQGEALTLECPAVPGQPTRYWFRVLGWERQPFSNTTESCTWKLELLPKDTPPAFCNEPERTAATLMPGETKDDIRAEPLRCNVPGADPEFCIDPDYRESCAALGADPVRCTDTGPEEGPKGATTVDKVAAI